MSRAGFSSLHWLDGGEKRAESCCLIIARYQHEDLQQPESRISEILCGAHLSIAPVALKCTWQQHFCTLYQPSQPARHHRKCLCFCVSRSGLQGRQKHHHKPFFTGLPAVAEQQCALQVHKRDADSQYCFAAYRLLWTLTRLQKCSVQVEQNLPLKLCQVQQWTAELDLCSSTDLQLQYRHSL